MSTATQASLKEDLVCVRAQGAFKGAAVFSQFDLPCADLKLQVPVCPAGRSFETVADVTEGKPQLLVKGLKSIWRQSPGILRTTLGGAVKRIILQDDVSVRSPPPHPSTYCHQAAVSSAASSPHECYPSGVDTRLSHATANLIRRPCLQNLRKTRRRR